MTDGPLTDLMMNGKSALIKGFRSSKTGNIFDAAVKFDANYKTAFEFPQKKVLARNDDKSKIFTIFLLHI